MAASFTAIPVGQGDAFLLVRADGTTILVDGGRARTVFASQLVSLRPTSVIDVAVCTHADADHAEGLVGLLEASLTKVREVWLPGRWTERLEALCVHPTEFLEELYSDIIAEKEPHPLEDPHMAESPVANEQLGVTDDVDIDLEGIEGALSSEGPWEPDHLEAHSRWLWPPWHDRAREALWIEAVQTAARIHKVARAAHHHGARIRWFDFEEARQLGRPEGGNMFLRPLNAVELKASVVRESVLYIFSS